MVIDDEATVGMVIKRMIEKNGYSAIVCTSSLEAISICRHTPPELIISDFNLPCFSNGVDLCLTIREATKENMPVIIISGQAENEDKARQTGFEFVRKPLKRQDFIPLLESCLA